MSLRAGRLRHRLTFMSPIQTPDGKGAVTESYATTAVAWGSIEPLRGKEYFESQLINSEVTGRIVTRYLGVINPSMIIIFNGRTFEIISIINVEEKNQELQIMVKEKVIA